MLIGISGKKQCGKDTVGKIIRALVEYSRYAKSFENIDIHELVKTYIVKGNRTMDDTADVRLHLFAEPLKRALGAIFHYGWEAFQLEEIKAKISPISKPTGGFYTFRELLQLFGTEVGRVISQNVWVDVLFQDYTPNEDWVITDVRFPNEAEAVKNRDGILIRVNRSIDFTDNHVSEVALDSYSGFDYIINNDGDLDILINNVADILENEHII